MTPGHSEPPWEIPVASQSSAARTSQSPEGGRPLCGSDPRPAGPRPPLLPAFGSSGPLAPHGCTAGLCNPAVPDTAPWVWASVTQSHTLTAFLALHSHSLSLMVTVTLEGARQPHSTDWHLRFRGMKVAQRHTVAESGPEPRASSVAQHSIQVPRLRDLGILFTAV